MRPTNFAEILMSSPAKLSTAANTKWIYRHAGTYISTFANIYIYIYIYIHTYIHTSIYIYIYIYIYNILIHIHIHIHIYIYIYIYIIIYLYRFVYRRHFGSRASRLNLVPFLVVLTAALDREFFAERTNAQ